MWCEAVGVCGGKRALWVQINKLEFAANLLNSNLRSAHVGTPLAGVLTAARKSFFVVGIVVLDDNGLYKVQELTHKTAAASGRPTRGAAQQTPICFPALS